MPIRNERNSGTTIASWRSGGSSGNLRHENARHRRNRNLYSPENHTFLVGPLEVPQSYIMYPLKRDLLRNVDTYFTQFAVCRRLPATTSLHPLLPYTSSFWIPREPKHTVTLRTGVGAIHGNTTPHFRHGMLQKLRESRRQHRNAIATAQRKVAKWRCLMRPGPGLAQIGYLVAKCRFRTGSRRV